MFKNISTPNLSDAGAYTLNLKPIIDIDKVVYGEAVTVEVDEKDWGTVVKAISYARNKVLVVKVHGNLAVFGGLATLNCKVKGVKGVVIDGYVRDLEDIKKLNFPVFARGVNPKAGKPLDRGKINIPIEIDNITVYPGDIIVGDINGVVVIKKEDLDKILKRVIEIKNKEKVIREKILRGYDLKDILKL
ncbi:RraA family protein [Methanocaldococcus indicus]|uniref:RraA family protein n=1 Tax=Methanocaldococcus indicus TaxID=213231 RepID=UPI003C6D31C7